MSEPDEAGGRRLAKGTWLWFGDERHQVVGQGGSEVHLLSAAGEWTTIYIAALVAAPGFRLLSESPVDLPSSMVDRGALLDGLDEDKAVSLRDLEAHLNEVRTGYRSGDPERAEPGEPRPAYDRALNPRVSDRVKAKAAELGMGQTTVWRKLRRYREEQRNGLIDGRGAVVRDPLARADRRVLDAILVQHRIGEREDSTGGLDRFYQRLQDRLNDEHGQGVVKLPSSSTIARYVEVLLPGQYTFGRAPSRRSAAARPQRSYRPGEAVRPGQVVMIDATPLDVIAYDPIGEVTHKVNLVLAIDVATRTLLAWRMTVGDTRAVDVVMLLNDAVTPEPMRPGWKQALAFRMLRLPITREVELEERLELAAARPVIWPETILVDHAKVNLSDALREACLDLGINLGLARKANPTDKANIERAFGTVREDFAKHVAGYKGSDTSSRGRLVEHAARWSLEDLEEFFAEYVVVIYQRRVHSGLVVPGFPELELSPNQAYGLMVARYGYIVCQSSTGRSARRGCSSTTSSTTIRSWASTGGRSRRSRARAANGRSATTRATPAGCSSSLKAPGTCCSGRICRIRPSRSPRGWSKKLASFCVTASCGSRASRRSPRHWWICSAGWTRPSRRPRAPAASWCGPARTRAPSNAIKLASGSVSTKSRLRR